VRESNENLFNADPVATAALPKINPLRRSLAPIDPLRYPGHPATRDIVLLGGHQLPLTPSPAAPPGEADVADRDGTELGELDEVLGAHGDALAAERTPVVAVGVNADPAVLIGKLEHGGASTVVPYLKAQVAGVRVCHSAHVSPGGYIPVTAAGAHGERADAAALLLDDEQLAVIDATEPNYRRVSLSADHQVTIASTGRRLDGCQAYDSRWGVLLDGGEPIAPMSQHRLFARLSRADQEFGRLTTGLTPQQITRLLAVEDLQEYLREHWRRSGFSRDAPLSATEQRAGP
jgi:hypothetical protein